MTRLFSLLVFVLLLPAAGPATAQAVPEWAAPSAPESAPVAEAAAQMRPPSTPGDPAQVPLDGGLGLLALAGGAFAAQRLRGKA